MIQKTNNSSNPKCQSKHILKWNWFTFKVLENIYIFFPRVSNSACPNKSNWAGIKHLINLVQHGNFKEWVCHAIIRKTFCVCVCVYVRVQSRLEIALHQRKEKVSSFFFFFFIFLSFFLKKICCIKSLLVWQWYNMCSYDIERKSACLSQCLYLYSCCSALKLFFELIWDLQLK